MGINTQIVVSQDESGYFNCDGVNDQIQIQEAINLASSNGNSSIFIRSGVYDISSTINIGVTGVNLIGEPGTILDGSNGTQGVDDIIRFYNGQNLAIEGITFRNAGRVSMIGDGSNHVIQNNTIENSYLQGINIQGNNNLITGNIVNGVLQEFGIVVGGYADKIIISNNIVSNTGGGGIQWGYSGQDVSIVGNIVKDCANGIEIGGIEAGGVFHTKDCTISGNHISGTTSGVGILTAQKSKANVSHFMENIFVIGNTIINSDEYAIRSENIKNYFCKSNIISSCNFGFVSLDTGVKQRNVISGNSFTDVGTQTIAVSSDNYIIKDNFCEDVTYDFIVANSGSSGFIVQNNVCKGVGRDFIRNDTPTNTKVSNTIL